MFAMIRRSEVAHIRAYPHLPYRSMEILLSNKVVTELYPETVSTN
jgi:hypothetical protein